jgi:hypothetical protein
MRLSCLGKRKSLRDQRLDLLLLKEVEQGDQILSKQCRLQLVRRNKLRILAARVSRRATI